MNAPTRKTTTRLTQGPDFETRIQVDRRNERLKVLAYTFDQIAPLADYLTEIARGQELGKIVVMARGSDWQSFLTRGYTLEGRVERYFQGSSGHYMAYFLSGERQTSSLPDEEQSILEGVLGREATAEPPLPDRYELATADQDSADELAAIYDRVFASYPSPLTDPEYIRELMRSGEGLFMIITDDGQIVSVAAAEIDRTNQSAELTNCATLPDFEGEGLMAVLIGGLEREMARQGIGCLYSMARALSFGMNLILRRAGYIYRGRLINHAHIGGGYENLNLWERPVAVETPRPPGVTR